MAIRKEDLGSAPGAVVYPFPSDRARAARRRDELRRRRIALVMAAAVVVGVLAGGGPRGLSQAGSRHVPRTVVLQPGETLWDVADRVAPAGADLRAYVADIVALNHLHGVPAAGQRIKLSR